MSQEKWSSKSNIVAIAIAVASIGITIIDKYWGLGGLAIALIFVGLLVIIARSRRSVFFPYLLLIIGFAFGQIVQVNFWKSDAGIIDNGVNIPADLWKFSGEIIDNEREVNREYTKTKAHLKSTQGENGYTSPVQKAIFTLFAPGAEDGIDQSPLQGIRSTIYIQPLNSSFADELIYCNYTLLYNGKSYTSSTYFVPVDKPTTLVWDFSSRADTNYDSLSDEIKTPLETAQKAVFQDDGGFVSLMRRHSESWNYQYLILKNYKPTTIENIALACGVSATKEFRHGNPGDAFDFQGYITLSGTILYPINVTYAVK